MKKVLLVNPWIHDFAAYDLWLKPWGLLKISSILKQSGFDVFFADALDRHHPLIKGKVKDKPDGTGKFHAEEIDRPAPLKDIPRKYKRYGLPPDVFMEALPGEDPDMILVSSGMTYWYPGVFECIGILRKRYPGALIVLGGIYATLAHEHAVRESGADRVIKNGELYRLSALMGKKVDFTYNNILDTDIDNDWYRDPPYAVLRLSLGCPFNCAYCAQKLLAPDLLQKDMGKALGEVEGLYEKGIKRFAFYDDALLVNSGYIREYLGKMIKKRIKADFYTPNGLHARYLDGEMALLIKEAGFKRPVLSLEISNDEKAVKWHEKVTRKEFEDAVKNLKNAGYREGEYTVYLMQGAPGMDPSDLREGMDLAVSLGAKVSVSDFSPIPGTPMSEGFPEALREPLLQNNTLTKLRDRFSST